jgi:hypothetical protein
VWAIKTKEVVAFQSVDSLCVGLQWSPQGNALAALTSAGNLTLWHSVIPSHMPAPLSDAGDDDLSFIVDDSADAAAPPRTRDAAPKALGAKAAAAADAGEGDESAAAAVSTTSLTSLENAGIPYLVID